MPTPVSRLVREYALILGLLLAAGGGSLWLLRLLRFHGPASVWAGWGLLIAGLGAGFILVKTDPWLVVTAPSEPELPDPSRPARWGAALGLLFTGGFLAYIAVARLWSAPFLWTGPLREWGLALGLLLLGSWLFGRFDFTPPSPQPPPPPPARLPARTTWPVYALFAGIFLLALFVRLYRLDQPPLVFVDETSAATDAIAILEGQTPSPFATGWYETPNGYIYAMAGLFKLVGANYLGLKLASLLPSLLTVAAVFLLARELFGVTVGLVSMFLLAINRWHMTMSRWGWNETATPLFFTLSAFFLLRGLRRRRALDFALGGLLAGGMIYTYLSSRLALASLALFALYWLLTDRGGVLAAWRRGGRGWLLFALLTAVTAAPLGVTYLSQPNTFWNRSAQISIFADIAQAGSFAPLWANLGDHLRLFYQQGDPTGRHNLPGEPQADPITGLFLAVGVGYGLLHLRDRRRGLLLLWLLLALAGGFLSERIFQPNTYRSLNAVVAVVILAGESMVRAAGLLTLPFAARGEKSRRRVFVSGSLLCLLLAGAGAWETQLFFRQQLPSPAVQANFSFTEMRISQEVLAQLDKDVAVYLSPRLYNFSPLRFLVWGAIQARTGSASTSDLPYHLLRPEVDLPLPGADGGTLILLDPVYASLLDYFRLFYPNADFRTVYGPDGSPSYLRAWISAGELNALQGLNAQVQMGDGSTPTLSLPTLQLEGVGSDVLSVLWTGSLRLEQSGSYAMAVDGDGQLTLDGEPWAGVRFLGRGLHRLEIAQKGASPVNLFWRRPDGVVEAIPSQSFFNIAPSQQGLWATYYANPNWSGPPLMEQITPFLLLAWPLNEPTGHPFSATYRGLLRVETPGFYQFRLLADDGVRFALDGAVLGEGLIPNQPNSLQVGLELAAGDHPIQIDYFQMRGGSALEFYWSPPGRGEVPVPPSVLLPGR